MAEANSSPASYLRLVGLQDLQAGQLDEQGDHEHQQPDREAVQ